MDTLPSVINEDYRSILAKAQGIFDFLDVSETTREEYRQRIGLFLDFLRKHPLNRNSFLEFKRYLKDRVDYSTSTKNKYLATSRIFLKELNRQGLLPADITQNIHSFQQLKRHKRDGLNDDEVGRLVVYLQGLDDTKRTVRIKAIFSFLIYQGLRQCEIVRLRISDIDQVGKVAHVRGKGRDDTEAVHLHPETVKNVKEYLSVGRIADGFLFPSLSNKNLHNQMTVRGLRQIVKATMSKAGVEKNVHGFRHYFTTRLIKTYKGDLLQVARYTRHRSLEMLQVYNDTIKLKQDLPRYYETFNSIGL